MLIILGAENCDPGETSGPTSINLKLVDDDGDVLYDSAKIAVCTHGEPRSMKRNALWQSPQNCKDSAVPTSGFSNGVVTATVSIAGQPDFEEALNAKCFK